MARTALTARRRRACWRTSLWAVRAHPRRSPTPCSSWPRRRPAISTARSSPWTAAGQRGIRGSGEMRESLSEQQKRHFETFGYLVLPGLMADDIGWITEEFEAVFRDRGVVHDGTKRSCIVPFIDQRERLSTLLDHPRLQALIGGLLGEEFNYLGGDGNFYAGDTGWHSDGFHRVGKFLKVALYLDPVARDTGCLRVIPGTHRLEAERGTHGVGPWEARQAGKARELWGIEQRDVPCMALE